MCKLIVLFVIFQFSNVPLSATSHDLFGFDWLVSSDFNISEIANLNTTDEHRRMLYTMWKDRGTIVWNLLRLELIAKTSGIEFCGVVKDEKLNIQSTAIVRAAYESLTKLQFQDQAMQAFRLALDSIYSNWNKTGDLGSAFVGLSSIIDATLKNETFYTTLVKEYANKDKWQPKKVYLSGIPKTEDDVKKVLAEFANAPQMKKFYAHWIFCGIYKEDDWAGKSYMKRLAALPDKREAIQKIYEEAIQDQTTQIGDLPANLVEFNIWLGRNLEHWQPILYSKLDEKIKANADLKGLFAEWQIHDSTTTTPMPVSTEPGLEL